MKKHLAALALVGAAAAMVATVVAYAVCNREYLERSLENYKRIYSSDENLFI